MKMIIMQMPMDFLEIPEPSLPLGFLELAEEARNGYVESGQSCYTEEVQSQEAGLIRPVFVTVIENSSSELKERATIAPGFSTEKIPPVFSAGRCYPIDRLGLVGPWDRTEQSVLAGSDAKEEGTDPVGPVGPDVSFDQIQPVAEGRASISHIAQWAQTECFPRVIQMAEGPVGQYITRSPVGPEGMLSTCDSNQPVADGPVGPSVIAGPVGPRRMLSQCKPDQPVAVGPVGQSFTTGPVGPCGIIPQCEADDPIADSPVSSTEKPDPVDETDGPIQIDVMKIVQTDGPASLVDTPPSSDSGIHSWGEQWENMSISTADTEAEQNVTPRICSPTGRGVSDTRAPPNTEEDEIIICPWMDCLLKGESSASGIRKYNMDYQCNKNVNFNSDRDPTSDDSSWEDYEECSDDL